MQSYNAQALCNRSGIDWETTELYEVITRLKLDKIIPAAKKVRDSIPQDTPAAEDPFALVALSPPVNQASEELENKNVYIVGGALRRTLVHGNLTTDIDLMFGSEKVFEAFKNELQYEIGNGDYAIPDKIQCMQETKHYTNFNIDLLTKARDCVETYKIQCINFAYFVDIQDCLDSFDYSIAQFGIRLDDLNTIYAGDYSLWDLARKKLVVNKITYPVASVRRMLKYKDQGFTICNGCIQQTLQDTVDLARDNEGIFSKNFHYID